MKRKKIQEVFIVFLQLLLGAMFFYAAIDKIYNPAKFAEIIFHYKILPFAFLNLCAIIIPWIEVGLSILLIFDVWPEIGAIILIVLTTVFVILIATAMGRGLNIECGCFSLDSGNSYVGWKRIIEDLLIIGGGLLILRRHLSGKVI